MTDSIQLAELIAKRFIARRDAKAIQGSDGAYRPIKTPFQMSDLVDHIEGRKTYGHYLLDSENQCKFFAFDCDLVTGDCEKKTRENPNPACCMAGHGNWVQQADLSQIPADAFTGPDAEHWFANNSFIHSVRPRDAWQDRSHPGRSWFKFQMRSLAELFSSAIHRQLGIEVLCSYSGHKGFHVYGLTGLMPAAEVREAAKLILASTGRFETAKGDNFYADTSTDWHDNYSNFSIEVFPKQDTVEPGHFGNLLRLPLGRNQKSSDPTFLLDQRGPHIDLIPHADPAALLTGGNPWL